VTYEFMKLQHQYEVFTRLAEVEAVVFVAEQLPEVIDQAWVRRHDWIIARTLKDESFRETLNDLIHSVDDTQDLDPDGRIADMLDKAETTFASFQGGRDLSVPDVYAEPLRTYRAELQAGEERRRANAARQQRRERLYQHIRDNLLHYCQAVWRAEDADQRLLRYKREGRRVPVEWRGPLRVVRAAAPTPLDLGDFHPTGRDADLWEVIDPTGPIDYVGNYAVYAVRPLPSHRRTVLPLDEQSEDQRSRFRNSLNQGELLLGLPDVVTEMAAPYREPGTSALRDPARTYFEQQAQRVDLQELLLLPDEAVYDLVAHLPRLLPELLDQNGEVARNNGQLAYQLTQNDWAQYLYLKNNTRRFLVDSNNLYLNLCSSGGVALEPFKRAHRYLDVLRAAEGVQTERLRNARRQALVNDPDAFDPDVDKVVVVGDGHAVETAALVHGLTRADAEAPVVPASPVADGEER
jgi:hypothetical protein